MALRAAGLETFRTSLLYREQLETKLSHAHLCVIPCSIREAVSYVARVHRHAPAVLGGRFAAQLSNGEGVAIAGNAVGRWKVPRVIEITRVATTGNKNACSMLYGAICRASKALGYSWAITYTRVDEPGTSLRAAGFTAFAYIPARQWNRTKRPRTQRAITDRIRWEREL